MHVLVSKTQLGQTQSPYEVVLEFSYIEVSQLSMHKIFFYTYVRLEIKPCGLGSRIRDMEADLIYW